jgi:hypothetical protein
MSDNEPVFEGLKKIEVGGDSFVVPTQEMILTYQEHLKPLNSRLHLVQVLMSEPVSIPHSIDNQLEIDKAVDRLLKEDDIKEAFYTREEVSDSVELLASLFQKMDENPFPGKIPDTKSDPRKQAVDLLVTFTDNLIQVRPDMLQNQVIKTSMRSFDEGFNLFLKGRLDAAAQNSRLDSLKAEAFPAPGSNPPEFGPDSKPYGGSSVTGGGVGMAESLSPYLDKPDMKVFNDAIIYYGQLTMEHFKPQFDTVTQKPGYMN